MLHGNVSRKGCGNALVGRYVAVLRKYIMRLMYDRAYHVMGLDAPAEFAPALNVRKGNARYRRG